MELKCDMSEKLNDPTKTMRRKEKVASYVEKDVSGKRIQWIDAKYKTSC